MGAGSDEHRGLRGGGSFLNKIVSSKGREAP